ncbi:hypothetical protein R5P67_02775 [Oenococcus oeni]|uniref:hypothetical protein n=1 Tax=Oenococcus oeni TaxID=1247 RepID=UPI000ABF86FC|nr:hypothetical protein [Oenococcus oeni]
MQFTRLGVFFAQPTTLTIALIRVNYPHRICLPTDSIIIIKQVYEGEMTDCPFKVIIYT